MFFSDGYYYGFLTFCSGSYYYIDSVVSDNAAATSDIDAISFLSGVFFVF
jgi:hypothetical protein